MIVKMNKVFIVSHIKDRQRLLDGLAEAGVLHLSPVDPDAAVADEETVRAIDNLRRHDVSSMKSSLTRCH